LLEQTTNAAEKQAIESEHRKPAGIWDINKREKKSCWGGMVEADEVADECVVRSQRNEGRCMQARCCSAKETEVCLCKSMQHDVEQCRKENDTVSFWYVRRKDEQLCADVAE